MLKRLAQPRLVQAFQQICIVLRRRRPAFPPRRAWVEATFGPDAAAIGLSLRYWSAALFRACSCEHYGPVQKALQALCDAGQRTLTADIVALIERLK